MTGHPIGFVEALLIVIFAAIYAAWATHVFFDNDRWRTFIFIELRVEHGKKPQWLKRLRKEEKL